MNWHNSLIILDFILEQFAFERIFGIKLGKGQHIAFFDSFNLEGMDTNLSRF